ncbi:MAG: LSU ribosomal protein L35P [Candidatus Nitrotoga sp. CP45]|jgi:large subunit ribosomal protein L35|nr:MAG: LSU ribosomal protein L35P [Candidatus Nitrotoga sp. CP45]CAH1070134.1 50S ribosomal subunit protein L35 [Candidatus Nitrotoga sp. 1052]
MSSNKGVVMPKMKTKSGAAKRFKVRAGGSIKRAQAFKRHILTKKTTKSKRQLRGTTEVHASNTASIRAMMPYA